MSVLNIFGSAQTALDGVNKVNDTTGAETDLEGSIGIIINAVIGVIGVVAVIMIILGGIGYVTSQGDAGKTKKARDTLLYGIIGLIIVLLAFAIVNFVLNALNG
ncbi:hypothetical protein IK110_03015 [Candidatus Saccharibacteria bacterium]|nr:hypothetical protein [Candidatus Saccharibacteria bacterium]